MTSAQPFYPDVGDFLLYSDRTDLFNAIGGINGDLPNTEISR